MWDELIPSSEAVRNPHLLYLLLGAFITLFSLTSLFIKDRLFMSEAMVSIIVGIIIGPFALNFFNPSSAFGEHLILVSLEFLRFVIAIQCMACGVDLPGNYIFTEWVSLAMLLGPVMIYMWVVSALGIYVIMGVPFIDALIIGACLTPTDPVLANSIVKGKFAEKHIPLNIRLLLSAESGANDGLGTPFLLFGVYLLRQGSSLGFGTVLGNWITKVLLYQVVLGIIIGFIIAYTSRIALKAAEKYELIDKESILSFSIALTLTVLGAVSSLGSDDILAVFVAGNDLWFNEKIVHSSFQEVIDALLNLTLFVYVGSLLPFSQFSTTFSLWRFFLLAIWMLVLRRLPIVFALQRWIPTIKDSKEAFFVGWFGPIGAGTLFYAHLAVEYFEYPASPIFEICFFVVLCSIFVHGGSVGLFNLTLSRAQTFNEWDLRRKGSGLVRFFTGISNRRPSFGPTPTDSVSVRGVLPANENNGIVPSVLSVKRGKFDIVGDANESDALHSTSSSPLKTEIDIDPESTQYVINTSDDVVSKSDKSVSSIQIEFLPDISSLREESSSSSTNALKMSQEREVKTSDNLIEKGESKAEQ